MPPKTSSKKSTSSSKDSPVVSDVKSSKSKTKTPVLTIENYILRPHANLNDDTNKSVVFVSQLALEVLDIKKGSFIKVSKGLQELVLLIDSNDEMVSGEDDGNVIQIHPMYLKMVSWLLGDRVQLTKFNGQLKYADEVNIMMIKNSILEDVKASLLDIGIIYPSMSNESSWFIKSINGGLTSQMENLNLDDSNENFILNPYLIHPTTTKFITIDVDIIPSYKLKHSFKQIGGITKQLEHIKRTLELPLNKPELFTSFGISPPRGILIHGNSGVGKSMILRSLGYEFLNCHVVKINSTEIVGRFLGETEERLRSLWQEAIKYQPSIILLDEIDTLVPSSFGREETTDTDNRVLTTMLTLLDDTDPLSKVVIVGATTRVNNVNLALRRPGRFDIEIEIPVPDVNGREDILSKLLSRMDKGRCSLTKEEEMHISSKTHGYVGSDLVALVREAVINGIDSYDQTKNPIINFEHFENAMLEIRPSAMKEIVLEMPKVKWSDIGGQEILKRKLKEMVQLPLTSGELFKQLGIKAPKGLLLYGPPGCSKTMTAKALASESGLNFLAIKGPEMFDKYVGESERKIREIFNKARASAPSIIFIDEIDAIALDRESGESSNVAKQVLNTMLNEIDGVEELKGVVIIGATNRPDSIDPALLRPGRLDRHVYVSPPDSTARKEIIDKNVIKFNLQDKETLLNELVELSDGFSGSECVLLCQEAGLNAIMEGNINGVESVRRDHFMNAMKEISRNITEEMLEYYESFGKKYSAI